MKRRRRCSGFHVTVRRGGLLRTFDVWHVSNRGKLSGPKCVLKCVCRSTLRPPNQDTSTQMHTTIQRLNGVFSFLTTVTFVLGACIALTSFLIPSNPTSDLKVSNFRVVNGRAPRSGSKATEFAFMNFDLDAGTSLPFPIQCVF